VSPGGNDCHKDSLPPLDTLWVPKWYVSVSGFGSSVPEPSRRSGLRRHERRDLRGDYLLGERGQVPDLPAVDR
jgi:hypothetical protein